MEGGGRRRNRSSAHTLTTVTRAITTNQNRTVTIPVAPSGPSCHETLTLPRHATTSACDCVTSAGRAPAVRPLHTNSLPHATFHLCLHPSGRVVSPSPRTSASVGPCGVGGCGGRPSLSRSLTDERLRLKLHLLTVLCNWSSGVHANAPVTRAKTFPRLP